MAKPTIFGANALLGGADGALDSIDGAILVDKDLAVVVDIDKFYPYQLDVDSAAGESSPLVISPDANAGDKRWILKKGVFAGLVSYGNVGIGGTPENALDIFGADANLRLKGAGDHIIGMTGYSEDDSYQLFSIRNDSDSYIAINTQNSTPLSLGVSDGTVFGSVTRQVTILVSGFVGIGTPVPYDILELNTPDIPVLIIRSSTEVAGGTERIRFMTGTGAAGHGNQVSAIKSEIIQADPGTLKGELSFWTNRGDAITETLKLRADGGILMHSLKSGANQGASGAVENELWIDTADQTIKVGVSEE